MMAGSLVERKVGQMADWKDVMRAVATAVRTVDKWDFEMAVMRADCLAAMKVSSQVDCWAVSSAAKWVFLWAESKAGSTVSQRADSTVVDLARTRAGS